MHDRSNINNTEVSMYNSLAISFITAGVSKIVLMKIKTGVHLLSCPSKIIHLDCYHNPFGAAAV
jgi:hypothetical protein